MVGPPPRADTSRHRSRPKSYAIKLTSQIRSVTCRTPTRCPAKTWLRFTLRQLKQMRPQRVTRGLACSGRLGASLIDGALAGGDGRVVSLLAGGELTTRSGQLDISGAPLNIGPDPQRSHHKQAVLDGLRANADPPALVGDEARLVVGRRRHSGRDFRSLRQSR